MESHFSHVGRIWGGTIPSSQKTIVLHFSYKILVNWIFFFGYFFAVLTIRRNLRKYFHLVNQWIRPPRALNFWALVCNYWTESIRIRTISSALALFILDRSRSVVCYVWSRINKLKYDFGVVLTDACWRTTQNWLILRSSSKFSLRL